MRQMYLGVVAALALSPAVALAGPYDGTYHGTLTGADGNGVNCVKRAPVQMTVTDNKLTYDHLSNATVNTTVAAGGSFSGSAPSKYTIGRAGPLNLTLDGKISGDSVTAVAKVSGYCTYNLQLQKFR